MLGTLDAQGCGSQETSYHSNRTRKLGQLETTGVEREDRARKEAESVLTTRWCGVFYKAPKPRDGALPQSPFRTPQSDPKSPRVPEMKDVSRPYGD